MRRQAHAQGLVFVCAVFVGGLAVASFTSPAGAAPASKTKAGASASASAASSMPVTATNPSSPTGPQSAIAPGSAGPAVPIPDKGAMDGATYSVRLRDLEARVDELKDQIRRSHTRLALLSDTIMTGGAAGSRSEVVYHNEMSSAFRLTRALFVVDGTVQYNRQDDTGALADQKEIPIFNGSIPPGDHTVQVVLDFQGNGYGVFTYLRGYKFEVKSAHSFTSVEGKTISITATSLEKGGVTTPLDQRPAIEWHETIGALGQGPAIATPPAAGTSTPQATPVTPVAPAATGSASFSIGGGSK